MSEAIQVLLSHAKGSQNRTAQENAPQANREWSYWQGRIEALEDALKAVKIEQDWGMAG
jgi:hypothetical protein